MKIPLRILTALLPTFLLPGLVLGEAGYTSANFLEIGMGARAAAMANSFTAVADDSTAIYWNPAGLGLVGGTSLSATHGQWLQGVTNDYIALSQQMSNGGGLGLAYINQSVQVANSTLEDAQGNYTGMGAPVNASDWALSAAYGDRLSHFIDSGFFKDTLMGLKVNLVGQNAITPVGNAISFEAGFLQVLSREHLTIGLDIQNVGTAIQNRSQPVLFKGGVSWYRLHNFSEGDKLILSGDVDLHDDTGFHPSFGTEFRSPLSRDFTGALRAGVQATDNLYGFSFLTFGAGIEKAFDGFDAGLDYAFVPYGAVGPTHRFSLNLRLGAPEVKVASNSLDAGVDFMKQGQLDKALKVFQDAVEKDPNDTNARNLMGTCLFKMGRLDEAQKINEKPKVVESDIH